MGSIDAWDVGHQKIWTMMTWRWSKLFSGVSTKLFGETLSGGNHVISSLMFRFFRNSYPMSHIFITRPRLKRWLCVSQSSSNYQINCNYYNYRKDCMYSSTFILQPTMYYVLLLIYHHNHYHDYYNHHNHHNHHIIELDDGKFYRKTLYLMVKTMVSG